MNRTILSLLVAPIFLSLSPAFAGEDVEVYTSAQADTGLAQRQTAVGAGTAVAGAAFIYHADKNAGILWYDEKNLMQGLPNRVEPGYANNAIKREHLRLSDEGLAELTARYREIYPSAQGRPKWAGHMPTIFFSKVYQPSQQSGWSKDWAMVEENPKLKFTNVHPDDIAKLIRDHEAKGYYAKVFYAAPDLSLKRKVISRGLGALTLLGAADIGISASRRVQLPQGTEICGGSTAVRCERTSLLKRATGAPAYQPAQTLTAGEQSAQ